MWEKIWRTTGWRRAMEEAAGKSDEDPRVKKLYSRAEQILAEATTPEKLKGNPFKGKPLYLDGGDPLEKEYALANRILKNAGYKPPWIETREELLAEKRALREAMARHLAMLEQALVERTAHERTALGQTPLEQAALEQNTPRQAKPQRAAGAAGGAGPDLAELRARHAAFLELLKERIDKLRRQILRFNLEVPIVEQQIVNVSYESFTQEMRSAAAKLLGLDEV